MATSPESQAAISASDNTDADTAVTNWQIPAAATEHPQAAEIVRQIDYYFSDDNLRQDAHLLAMFKEGNGTVSLSEVLRFPKMRKFKQPAKVKTAVKQSTVVEIVGDGKRLRRRDPLQKAITVKPKLSENRQHTVVPEDKPWLTKNMMKETGFEEYATAGPIDPKEYEEDRREYDPDNAFTERIETAIRKFNSRRKMHTDTRLIFEKYMIYGGMDAGQSHFTGGIDNRMKEDLSKQEIAEMTAHYNVSERVLDGFADEAEGERPTYVVDFEATAKGFLSSQFPNICNWYDPQQVNTACKVLRNFYNYLLLHDVCPEYTAQLHGARKVCDLAEEEFPKLSAIDTRLPGAFNKACSTLVNGNYADLNAANGDWVVAGDDIGLTKEDAKTIFLTSIFAHGTEEQLAAVENIQSGADALAKALTVISEEDSMGLEVTSRSPATESALKIYSDVRLTNTLIKPMGKLRCKRWNAPHARPQDLPTWLTKKRKQETSFEFLLEEDTLKHCYPGMKIEACVKELSLGVKFIDYYEAIYASFFTWLPNEYIREWKEPGPLKSWMRKVNARAAGNAVGEIVEGNEAADGGEEGDEDEMPD